MRYRRRSIRQRIEDANFDLNLAPMLDMMVALVPFLLLSIAFVRLVVVDTPIPQPVQSAIEKNKKDKNPKVVINMHIHHKKGVRIAIQDRGKRKNILIPLKDSAFDVENVHQNLVQLKQKYPQVFKMEVFPTELVAYKDIISLMDSARSSLKEDPELYIEDPATGKKIVTKLMFPNITFGNIIGDKNG